MTKSVFEWFERRNPRERWLIILMLAIAIPLLGWLIVFRPLNSAYDKALDRHLEAVDRNGRVRMLAEATKERPALDRPAQRGAELGLVVAEAAAQSGLALESNTPAGPNQVSVSVGQATAPQALQWLLDLEARGLSVDQWRMTPAGNDAVAVTAQIVRVG